MSEEVKKVAVETKAEEKKPFSLDTLIGLAKSAAEELAKAAGYKTRTIEEDGVAKMVTMDIQSKRVNFTIAKGLVEKAKLG